MEIAAVWAEPAIAATDFVQADPLGLEQLEQRVAGWFWPGFTERTTRAGYYPVVAYGLRIAEEAARKYGLPVTDDNLRGLFQRWERLWAMAVCLHHRGEISARDKMRGARGVERAYRRRGRGRLPLDYPMIAHGRELGALGAFLASLRAHHFVAVNRLRVTPLGWQLAAWMWGEPEAEVGDEADVFVLETLNPDTSTIPNQVGRLTLARLGERASLSEITRRPRLQQLLVERLFAGGKAQKRAAGLADMARARLAGHAQDLVATREFFSALQHGTGELRVATDLRHAATRVGVFTDLGQSLLEIFARTCRLVVESGYQRAWSDCVQHSVTPEVVEALHLQLEQWRRLGMDNVIAPLGGCGRIFAYTVERLTPQNAHSLFDSVLMLHRLAQGALGQGGGWLARQRDDVFLRGRGVELMPSVWSDWRPTFLLPAIDSLLRDLGQLS